MSSVTCNCCSIAASCKLYQDKFESNIIMNILYIGNHGVYIICYIRTLFQDLGPHTIVILYNPEPTIPGASYGPSHTCSLIIDILRLT